METQAKERMLFSVFISSAGKKNLGLSSDESPHHEKLKKLFLDKYLGKVREYKKYIYTHVPMSLDYGVYIFRPVSLHSAGNPEAAAEMAAWWLGVSHFNQSGDCAQALGFFLEV